MGWFGGGGSDGGDTGGDTGFASKKKTYDYGDTGSSSAELDLRHEQGKAGKKSQVMQCLGFGTADFLSSIALESAEKNPNIA